MLSSILDLIFFQKLNHILYFVYLQYCYLLFQDGKVNGVTRNTRLLGCAFLYPHTIPLPYSSQLALKNDDEFLIIGNRGLWHYVTHNEAVELIYEIGNPVVAAKKLQDIAQAYGCQENVAVMVIRLNTDRGPSLGRLRPTNRELSVDDVEAAAKHDAMRARRLAKKLKPPPTPTIVERRTENFPSVDLKQVPQSAPVIRVPESSKSEIRISKQKVSQEGGRMHDADITNVSGSKERREKRRSQEKQPVQNSVGQDDVISHHHSTYVDSNGNIQKGSLEHIKNSTAMVVMEKDKSPESGKDETHAPAHIPAAPPPPPLLPVEPSHANHQPPVEMPAKKHEGPPVVPQRKKRPQSGHREKKAQPTNENAHSVEVVASTAKAPGTRVLNLKPLPTQKYTRKTTASDWENLLQQRLSKEIKHRELEQVTAEVEQPTVEIIEPDSARVEDEKPSEAVVIVKATTTEKDAADGNPVTGSSLLSKTKEIQNPGWLQNLTPGGANPAYLINPGISPRDLYDMTSTKQLQQAAGQSTQKQSQEEKKANVRSRIAMFENLSPREVSAGFRGSPVRKLMAAQAENSSAPPRRALSPPPNLVIITKSQANVSKPNGSEGRSKSHDPFLNSIDSRSSKPQRRQLPNPPGNSPAKANIMAEASVASGKQAESHAGKISPQRPQPGVQLRSHNDSGVRISPAVPERTSSLIKSPRSSAVSQPQSPGSPESFSAASPDQSFRPSGSNTPPPCPPPADYPGSTGSRGSGASPGSPAPMPPKRTTSKHERSTKASDTHKSHELQTTNHPMRNSTEDFQGGTVMKKNSNHQRSLPKATTDVQPPPDNDSFLEMSRL